MNSGIDLRPAEAALVRNYEPGHVAARRSCNYIGIVVPEAEIKLLNLDPERLFSINWHRQNAAMVLLKNYVACIERSPPQTSSNVRGAVSRHIIELFGLAAREALGSEPTSDGESIRAARLRLTLAYIARHFAEPDLSITSVAASQSISARYLHRLFETADLQFISHVNEWRLQKAADRKSVV